MNVLSAAAIVDLLLKDTVRQEDIISTAATCCLHYPRLQASRIPVCLSVPY